MKRIVLSLLFFIATWFSSPAQITPEIKSWIINTTGQTGYDGIPSNVQVVQYTTDNVYISCTCIPGYSIGPWKGDPNVPANQNFVFKITRNPVQDTGTATAVGLGHTGVWTNGVSIFNVSDAMTYNNDGVWFRNAYYFEGPSFDDCLGHPQQNGEYHHHVSPACLYNQADSTHHSPIIGFAFDGFPVYGAYGYADTNGTGSIKRMSSSYQLRNITTRTTLPDGSTASAVGPAVSDSFPLGAFIQDYIYEAGSGDLDTRNGRFCVTPDYPSGIYAYFVTIDSTLAPVFPYTFYGTYYGVVQDGNIGPASGHNTISDSTTIYNPPAGINEINRTIKFKLEPNPMKDYAYIYFDPKSANNIKGSIYDVGGKLVETFNNLQPSISYALNFTSYSAGTYFLHLDTDKESVVQKIVKIK